MKERNQCYTYFRIVGTFDPDEVTQRLGLTPFEVRRIGDLLPNGRPVEFASWLFGRCDAYEPVTDEQMWQTIEPLLEKKTELNAIREQYEVTYWLEVVPEIYAGESTPSLAPSLEVMEFCLATKTRIDIDLYVYSKKSLSEKRK